jgi:predicted dehydrogenase
VAISDVNQIAADQAAARLGIPRSFPDLAAMLAGFLKIDAVSVIVPNKFHMPVAIQALQAGMHVFCEKPPALNAIETLAMGN